AHLGVLGLAGVRRHRFGPAERLRAPAGARRHRRRPGLDRVLPHRRNPAGPVHLLRHSGLRKAEPAPHRSQLSTEVSWARSRLPPKSPAPEVSWALNPGAITSWLTLVPFVPLDASVTLTSGLEPL